MRMLMMCTDVEAEAKGNKALVSALVHWWCTMASHKQASHLLSITMPIKTNMKKKEAYTSPRNACTQANILFVIREQDSLIEVMRISGHMQS